MVAKVNFQISDYTIANGASEILAIPGEFFHVLRSTAAFNVYVDDGGKIAGMTEGLGWRVRGEPFAKLRLENVSGASVAIKIAVGFGDFNDARVQFSTALKVGASAAAFTYGGVSVGTAAVQLSAANVDRTRAIVRAGGTDLWLGPDNTVTATGPATVQAGQSLEILHRGAIYAIRAAGTVAAGFYEETE